MVDFFKEMAEAIGKNDPPTTVKHWLDTGHPLLNDAISGSYHGGLPCGRIVEMFGPPSCGKTAISTAAMISAQRAGGVAGFMDHENSFDHHLAEAMGLDTKNRWIFKTPDTFEQSIAIAGKSARVIRERKLIAPDAPIVFAFDSLASMVPRSKFDKGVEEYNMNDTTALARATSAAFPALAKFCETYEFLALFLNQVRTKPGVVYGDPETTPGGSAPEFYSSVRISLRRAQKVKGSGAAKEITGQTITARIVKNKVHRPFETAKWDFVFTEEGDGRFDPVGSVLDHLVEIGVVERDGRGAIVWDGKKLWRDDVVARIEADGRREELFAMLPGYLDETGAKAA